MTTVATRVLPKLALYAPLRSVAEKTSSKRQEALVALCQSVYQPNDEVTNHRQLFSGVEASLHELGVDPVEQIESSKVIQEVGLELLVNVNVRGKNASECVRSFESQLSAIPNLGEGVAHINCRTHGIVDQDMVLDYLLYALPLSAEFLEDHSHIGKDGNETDIMGGAPHHLTGISHETNRAGMFYHPDATRYLLEVVPPLRLTMNLSSWHEACGHPWGSKDSQDEAEALSVEIVPHIDLIRTTIDRFQYHTTHRFLWETVWTRKANRGVEQLYMTLDIDDHDSFESKICDEKESSSKLKRLTDAANGIHEFYSDWSTTMELETELS